MRKNLNGLVRRQQHIIATFAASERGLSTAEYAVGTVAVAGLGGLLLKILTSDFVRELIMKIIEFAFSFLF